MAYIFRFGCFITAYARKKTIETSQKIKEYSIKKYGKDLYIYSDTDSIHTLLNIEELKNRPKVIILNKEINEICEKMNLEIDISISHCKTYAVASVVAIYG